MKKKVAVIGSGIAGISAASYAAKDGFDVTVFEKNSQAGGRARQLITSNGYTFDMGPSWYWMPDIVEHFFKDFGQRVSDFYELKDLDPQFEIIFANGKICLPANFESQKVEFEKLETGAAQKLDDFMKAAEDKYKVAMSDFVFKPCHSWWEFFSFGMLKNALTLHLLTNFRSYVGRYFKHPKLRALMEFPVIFLGASPQKIPAMYSLMNYGGYVLGTKYPVGGFYELVKAMHQIALNQGVKFKFNHTVDKIHSRNGAAYALTVNGEMQEFDAVIAASDYHHTETLLDENVRNYDEKYWNNKTFAPSCLIFYLGFDTKLKNVHHHTLFFENDLDQHIADIYDKKKWPENPLFYMCCPSQTDNTVAPENHENVFLLMPLAIGISDDEQHRESYFLQMIRRIEKHTGMKDLISHIDYKKSYCIQDFITDYHAYKGNAYGLANTLGQTAVLKPSIKNKKLTNLFYAGQLTVPGPGIPPSIISGKIVANELKKLKFQADEKII
jgi:phytoene desaturase